MFEADLSGANLRGANLYEANLINAELTGANLYEANLFEADLSGANLRGANLCEADLTNAELTGANLYEADLRGADLREADLRETDGFLLLPFQDLGESCANHAVASDDGWLIVTGNWRLTINDAKAHWGDGYKGDPAHAKMYLAAIDWLESKVAQQERGNG